MIHRDRVSLQNTGLDVVPSFLKSQGAWDHSSGQDLSGAQNLFNLQSLHQSLSDHEPLFDYFGSKGDQQHRSINKWKKKSVKPMRLRILQFEDEEECIPFFESELELFERVAPMFTEGDPLHVVKLGEHYTWDEVEPLFIYLAQGLYGDVSQYGPPPPAYDVLEKLKYDYWKKAEGLSKKEARKKFLEAALPIMDREGFSYENPKKALADKKYKECIDEKIAAGQSLEQIEKARAAFLAQQNDAAAAKSAEEEEKVVVLPPKSWKYDLLIWGAMNCCLLCCICCLCRSVCNKYKLIKMKEGEKQQQESEVEKDKTVDDLMYNENANFQNSQYSTKIKSKNNTHDNMVELSAKKKAEGGITTPSETNHQVHEGGTPENRPSDAGLIQKSN